MGIKNKKSISRELAEIYHATTKVIDANTPVANYDISYIFKLRLLTKEVLEENSFGYNFNAYFLENLINSISNKDISRRNKYLNSFYNYYLNTQQILNKYSKYNKTNSYKKLVNELRTNKININHYKIDMPKFFKEQEYNFIHSILKSNKQNKPFNKNKFTSLLRYYNNADIATCLEKSRHAIIEMQNILTMHYKENKTNILNTYGNLVEILDFVDFLLNIDNRFSYKFTEEMADTVDEIKKIIESYQENGLPGLQKAIKYFCDSCIDNDFFQYILRKKQLLKKYKKYKNSHIFKNIESQIYSKILKEDELIDWEVDMFYANLEKDFLEYNAFNRYYTSIKNKLSKQEFDSKDNRYYATVELLMKSVLNRSDYEYNFKPTFIEEIIKLYNSNDENEQEKFLAYAEYFLLYYLATKFLLRKYKKYKEHDFYKHFKKTILSYSIDYKSLKKIEKFLEKQEDILIVNSINSHTGLLNLNDLDSVLNIHPKKSINYKLGMAKKSAEAIRNILINNFNVDNQSDIKNGYRSITDIINFLDLLLTADDKLKTNPIIKKQINTVVSILQSIVNNKDIEHIIKSFTNEIQKDLPSPYAIDNLLEGEEILYKYSKYSKSAAFNNLENKIHAKNVEYLSNKLEHVLIPHMYFNKLKSEFLNDFSRLTPKDWQQVSNYFSGHKKSKKFSKHNKLNDFGVSFLIDKKGTIHAIQTRKIIGNGSFGRVKIIQNKKGIRSALKIEPAIDFKGREIELEILRLSTNLYKGDMHLKDKFYTAMQLCKDGDLIDYINNNKQLTIADKLEIAIKCVESIMDLHKKGIIHADIKPDNFLINKEGDMLTIICADYGLSMFVEKDKDYCMSLAKGTLNYMAPEIKKNGYCRFSSKTDIYALGVMFKALKLPADIYKDMLAVDYNNRPKLAVTLDKLKTAVAKLKLATKNKKIIFSDKEPTTNILPKQKKSPMG